MQFGVLEMDMQGKIRHVNKVVTELLSKRPDALTGTHWSEALHWTDSSRHKGLKEFEQFSNELKQSNDLTLQYYSENDTLISLEIVQNAQFNDSLYPTGIQWFIVNHTDTTGLLGKHLITNTKECEEAEEIGRFGRWYLNYETGESGYSKMLVRLHEQNPNTFSGTLEDLVANAYLEDRKQLHENIQEAVKKGQYSGELIGRVKSEHGSTKKFLLRWKAELRENELVSIHGTSQDLTKQIDLEDELKARNVYLSHLLETIPDAVVLINKTSLKIVEANKQAYRLYGKETLIGLPCQDLSLSKFDSEIALENSLHAPVLRQHLCGDKAIDVEIYSSLLNTESENSEYLVVIRDVTARKGLEKEVQNKTGVLQHILDTVPSYVFWKDTNSHYLGGNKNFLHIAGLKSQAELVGKTDYDLPWKHFTREYQSDDKKVLSTRSKLTIDQEFGVGPIQWIKTTKVPLLNSQGNTYGVLGIFNNITAEKCAQEKLEKSEALFRGIFDNGDQGVLIVNEKGVVLQANMRICSMLQYDQEELIGKTYFEITVEKSLGEETPLWEQLKNKQIDNYTLKKQYKKKNGDIFWIFLSAVRIDLSSEDSLYVGVIQDINEEIQTTEKLIKSENALKQAQEIAHIGYWHHNIATNEIELSDETFRILGLQIPDIKVLSSETFYSYIHPQDLDVVIKSYNRSLELQIPFDITHRITKSDGEIRYVRERALPPKEKADSNAYTSGIVMDITEQVQAKHRVLESEAKYRAIFQAGAAVVIEDMERNIIDCNKSFLELFEYDLKHEILGRKISTLNSDIPFSVHSKLNTASIISAKEYPVKYEGEFFTQSGNKVVGSLSSSLSCNPETNEEFIVTVFRDITQESIMKKKIQQSEEKFRTVADYTYDWEYWISSKGKFLYVAPSVERITGYPAELFINNDVKKMLEIVHPDDRVALSTHLKNDLHGTSTPYEMDFRIITASGKIRWMAHVCQPIVSKGKYLGHRAANRDITENKKLHLQILENEKRLSLIANNIEEIFWLLAPDGEILEVNNSFQNIFGFDSVKENFWDLDIWEKTDIETVKGEFATNVKSGNLHFSIEAKWQKMNKEKRVCRNSITLLIDEHDNLKNIVIVSQDITRYKEVAKKEKLQQEQLRQADKMTSLGILVSGVAHEINNPNNLIMLNSSFISKIWKDVVPVLDKENLQCKDLKLNKLEYSMVKEKMPRMLENISIGSDRIKEIVHSLKEFVRVDSGKLSNVFDINGVIKSSIRIVRNEIKKSTYDFTVHYSVEELKVKGNAQQLEQVVINLITNACQALSSPSQKITVTIEPCVENSVVRVLISDTGEGIPSDVLQKIMDPFFTTKRDFGGTGLGLSVSHSIIKAHDGHLSYVSEVGTGTIATIELPLCIQ